MGWGTGWSSRPPQGGRSGHLEGEFSLHQCRIFPCPAGNTGLASAPRQWGHSPGVPKVPGPSRALGRHRSPSQCDGQTFPATRRGQPGASPQVPTAGREAKPTFHGLTGAAAGPRGHREPLRARTRPLLARPRPAAPQSPSQPRGHPGGPAARAMSAASPGPLPAESSHRNSAPGAGELPAPAAAAAAEPAPPRPAPPAPARTAAASYSQPLSKSISSSRR